MSGNIYAFALKNTLDELQNTCPSILHALIFKGNELLAKTENTNERTANNTINAFKAITERADTIGDITTATIQAAKGKVNLSCIYDFYMGTVLSQEADEKYVNALIRTLIPIIIKLAANFTPAQVQETLTEPGEEAEQAEKLEQEEQAQEVQEETETILPTVKEQEIPEENGEENSSTPPARPPATQLIVENLSGLLVRSDTVQLDKSVIEEWNSLYGDRKIEEVQIEALNGKTTRCKFKPIKDSKQEGKGIIKIHEKIQIELEATQGDLVIVKPVVE